MAFANQVRWMATFNLPDGPHVMCGFASTRERAIQGFKYALETNPEASLDEASVKPASVNDVDQAVADLRAADPSRPLATDLGLDTPQRVLHAPWVVPGSQIAPPEPTE